MAQKPFCCRTKIRMFFTLSVFAALTLFMFNVITQVTDIPPSHHQAPGMVRRNKLIDKWRNDRVVKQKPLIPQVQCTGDKCKIFMGVLGLDEANAGNAVQYCRHPLFLPANDTIANSFPHLPPLHCQKNTARCGYSDQRIMVAEGWSCLLQSIHRLPGSDDKVHYVSPIIIEKSMPIPVDATGDFFRLSCTTLKKLESASGQNQTEKLLGLVARKQVAEEHFITRISKYPDGVPDHTLCPKEKCMNYSVLVLGIGSLSHMSFQRLLPKTYEFFTKTLKAMKFDGYNAVGDSTNAALLPLLTGLEERKQPEVRVNKPDSHFVDKLDLLWNAYDGRGFMTLYAEDNPPTNTFNGQYNGFENSPTAHYMRPFWLAAQSLGNTSHDHCLGPNPRHHYMLEYLLQFHMAYDNERRFSLAMFKDLTESNILRAQHLDLDLVNFFSAMKSYLENTIVILMSDHGILPKQSLDTWQSKAEARMPLLFIYLPSSFLSNYTKYAHAMVKNEDKLVTPYDVHHTLKDIIDMPRLEYEDPRDIGRFGQSLFKAIPVNRTCKSAGVDIHWCACHTQFKVQPHEIDMEKVNDLILEKLNHLTSDDRDHCFLFNQLEVLSITRLVPNEQIHEFESQANKKFTIETLLDKNYYQLTFKAFTSDTDTSVNKFEVTVEHMDAGVLAVFSKSYQVVSNIVRLGEPPQQKCVDDSEVAKYCRCSK